MNGWDIFLYDLDRLVSDLIVFLVIGFIGLTALIYVVIDKVSKIFSHNVISLSGNDKDG